LHLDSGGPPAGTVKPRYKGGIGLMTSIVAMWTKRSCGRRRGRWWGQTSTYRFAAVKLHARVKVDVIVDVIVERHGNGDECAAAGRWRI
jgi:hypothetical protein